MKRTWIIGLALVLISFSSVAWAGSAAIAASGSWVALGPTAIALLVLAGAWLIRPK